MDGAPPQDYAQWRFGAPTMAASPVVPNAFAAAEREKALAAALRNPAYWQRTWEGADTVEVKDVDVMPWPGVNGYAACDKNTKRCALIMNLKAPNYDCTLGHEKVHAAGFDHPNQRHNLECAEKMPLPR